MDNQAKHNEALHKLAEMIGDIKFAMLTTVEPDGTLRSRPMVVQQTEFDGDLWFFTGASAPKVDEIERNPNVNVVFAKPSDNSYVSMSGQARFTTDRAKAEQLWNPMLKAYFPDGLDDPNLGLLKIEVSQAEFWDSPSSSVVHLLRVAKSMATGESYQEQAKSDDVKLNLS